MIADFIANQPKRRKGESNQGFKDQVIRFRRRERNLFKAWRFGDYIIARCGSEIQYYDLSGPNPTVAQKLNIDLGTQVHLQQVTQTGVLGLLQFFLINDQEKIIFVITWNMNLNREHGLFQTRFKAGQFPENLLLSSFGGVDSAGTLIVNYNFCLEDGALINLEDNMPVQFFDKENETDLIPHGPMKPTVQGQKKVSRDRQYYLDIVKPGRIQMFISLSDLTYWERFTKDKQNHELTRGRVSTFAPISRFPNGISIFHKFATNIQVISTFANSYELEKAAKVDDKRIALFPLIFLHQHPVPNKQKQRVTPLEIAIEKQGQACFETMLEMLVRQTNVCITGNVLGRLKEMINNPSIAVIDLFSNGFRITDQLEGPRPLTWNGDDEELFIDVPTAYLTNDTLQRFVDEA